MKEQRKISLVIGGGSGLGFSIAEGFSERGDDVIIASRNTDKLKAAEDKIKSKTGKSVFTYACDVTNEDSLNALKEVLKEKYKTLDSVVCTAGMHLKKSVLDTSYEEWQKVMEINASGTFLVNRIFGEYLAGLKKGYMINISSLGAKRALSLAAAYCASKSAVESITRSFAIELAPFNVKVNAIVPGVFETELNKKALSDPTRRENILNCTPMKRFGNVEEIKGAALLLSSDEAAFMSGCFINVDGGFLAYSGY